MPEPHAQVTPGLGPVTIFGVEYDRQDARDRILVLGEDPVDYLVYEPDAETVVLSIEGAVIDPEAAVRIAPEPAGAVSLVTAFQQPETETPEVRLVMKRQVTLTLTLTPTLTLIVQPHTPDHYRASAPAAPERA